MAEKVKAKDLGLKVRSPEQGCTDSKCPFHGTVRVRGMLTEGVVASDRMASTVVVQASYVHYIPKFKRYERRKSRMSAHNPPCINARAGDKVRIAETRPLSKTVHFVVVEKVSS